MDSNLVLSKTSDEMKTEHDATVTPTAVERAKKPRVDDGNQSYPGEQENISDDERQLMSDKQSQVHGSSDENTKKGHNYGSQTVLVGMHKLVARSVLSVSAAASAVPSLSSGSSRSSQSSGLSGQKRKSRKKERGRKMEQKKSVFSQNLKVHKDRYRQKTNHAFGQSLQMKAVLSGRDVVKFEPSLKAVTEYDETRIAELEQSLSFLTGRQIVVYDPLNTQIAVHDAIEKSSNTEKASSHSAEVSKDCVEKQQIQQCAIKLETNKSANSEMPTIEEVTNSSSRSSENGAIIDVKQDENSEELHSTQEPKDSSDTTASNQCRKDCQIVIRRSDAETIMSRLSALGSQHIESVRDAANVLVEEKSVEVTLRTHRAKGIASEEQLSLEVQEMHLTKEVDGENSMRTEEGSWSCPSKESLSANIFKHSLWPMKKVNNAAGKRMQKKKLKTASQKKGNGVEREPSAQLKHMTRSASNPPQSESSDSSATRERVMISETATKLSSTADGHGHKSSFPTLSRGNKECALSERAIGAAKSQSGVILDENSEECKSRASHCHVVTNNSTVEIVNGVLTLQSPVESQKERADEVLESKKLNMHDNKQKAEKPEGAEVENRDGSAGTKLHCPTETEKPSTNEVGSKEGIADFVTLAQSGQTKKDSNVEHMGDRCVSNNNIASVQSEGSSDGRSQCVVAPDGKVEVLKTDISGNSKENSVSQIDSDIGKRKSKDLCGDLASTERRNSQSKATVQSNMVQMEQSETSEDTEGIATNNLDVLVVPADQSANVGSSIPCEKRLDASQLSTLKKVLYPKASINKLLWSLNKKTKLTKAKSGDIYSSKKKKKKFAKATSGDTNSREASETVKHETAVQPNLIVSPLPPREHSEIIIEVSSLKDLKEEEDDAKDLKKEDDVKEDDVKDLKKEKVESSRRSTANSDPLLPGTKVETISSVEDHNTKSPHKSGPSTDTTSQCCDEFIWETFRSIYTPLLPTAAESVDTNKITMEGSERTTIEGLAIDFSQTVDNQCMPSRQTRVADPASLKPNEIGGTPKKPNVIPVPAQDGAKRSAPAQYETTQTALVPAPVQAAPTPVDGGHKKTTSVDTKIKEKAQSLPVDHSVKEDVSKQNLVASSSETESIQSSASSASKKMLLWPLKLTKIRSKNLKKNKKNKNKNKKAQKSLKKNTMVSLNPPRKVEEPEWIIEVTSLKAADTIVSKDTIQNKAPEAPKSEKEVTTIEKEVTACTGGEDNASNGFSCCGDFFWDDLLGPLRPMQMAKSTELTLVETTKPAELTCADRRDPKPSIDHDDSSRTKVESKKVTSSMHLIPNLKSALGSDESKDFLEQEIREMKRKEAEMQKIILHLEAQCKRHEASTN